MLQKSKNSENDTPVSSDNGLIKETYVIVKSELCKACGLCIEFCPKKVLHRGKTISGMGYEYTVYCGEGCIGCGTCFYVCPEPGVITVVKRKLLNDNE